MEIRNNTELIQAVNQTIKESGYKKIWIAKQMGITRQALTKQFEKQNFTIEDANKILDKIGYECLVVIEKKLKKE